MAQQHRRELQEVRRRLQSAGVQFSAAGLSGEDSELMRFAFTCGLTRAQTKSER